MEKIIVGAENIGKRIDKFLAEEFFLYSRGEISEKIKVGEVLLNGKTVKPSYKLAEGDKIEIENFSNEEKKLLPDQKIELEIIFENKEFLIINKPAGLQVHPGNSRQTSTLASALLVKYPEIVDVHDGGVDAYLRPGIVHRLDKDTSGVMVIAKKLDTFKQLKKIFKDREIEKKYLAIVDGIVDNKNGIIEKPLARSAGFSKQLIARANTRTKIREAVTNYEVLRQYEKFALLEVVPKTGRMHQIRVHLASIGHPIVGDVVYGKNLQLKNSNLKVKRQLLHAKKLAFDLDGNSYDFEAEIPKDFEYFLNGIKEIS